MTNLINLANKIKKTLDNGKNEINVGGFVFNLKEIINKLQNAKNGEIIYDLSKHGVDDKAIISSEKLKELYNKALSGLPFKFLGETSHIPFKLSSNTSNIISIVKYLVIAGFIIFIIYLVKKGVKMISEPVGKVIKQFTPDIRTEREITTVNDNKIKNLIRMLQAKQSKYSFFDLLKTIDLYPLTNSAYYAGEVPDIKKTKEALENDLREIVKIIQKNISTRVQTDLIGMIRSIPRPYIDMIDNDYLGNVINNYLSDSEKLIMLKKAFGFDQDKYNKNVKNLKGDNWGIAYLELWRKGIIERKNQMILELEKRRRLSGLTENLLHTHYKKRGWNTTHPDQNYIQQAAKVLNYALPIDFSREIFSPSSIEHSKELDKYFNVDAKPVVEEWLKLNESFYDKIFPSYYPNLERVYKLILR